MVTINSEFSLPGLSHNEHIEPKKIIFENSTSCSLPLKSEYICTWCRCLFVRYGIDDYVNQAG